VGHGGDLLDCHPALTRMWEAAGLEPCSRPKHAAYLALCPEALSGQVTRFMANVGASYQACRLGSLWPAPVPQALQAQLATAAAAAARSELPRLPLLPAAGMAALQAGVVPLQPVPGSGGAVAGGARAQAQQQQQQQQGAAQPGWYTRAVREAAQQLRRALSSQQQPLRCGAWRAAAAGCARLLPRQPPALHTRPSR
jgi:hypothetical protein